MEVISPVMVPIKHLLSLSSNSIIEISELTTFLYILVLMPCLIDQTLIDLFEPIYTYKFFLLYFTAVKSTSSVNLGL